MKKVKKSPDYTTPRDTRQAGIGGFPERQLLPKPYYDAESVFLGFLVGLVLGGVLMFFTKGV
jgi:hypothetical protein